eukprot:1195627-Prorocentrum_minimum.AAC.1
MPHKGFKSATISLGQQHNRVETRHQEPGRVGPPGRVAGTADRLTANDLASRRISANQSGENTPPRTAICVMRSNNLFNNCMPQRASHHHRTHLARRLIVPLKSSQYPWEFRELPPGGGPRGRHVTFEIRLLLGLVIGFLSYAL